MNKKILSALSVLFGLTLLAACAASVSPMPSATATLPAPTPTRFVIRITEPADQCPELSEAEQAALIVETIGHVEDALDLALSVNSDAEMLTQVGTAQIFIASAQDAIRIYIDRYAELEPEAGAQLDAIAADLETINGLLTELAGADSADSPTLVEQLAEEFDAFDLPGNVNSWQEQVLAHIDARETTYMSVQPARSAVANNRIDAFIQAHDFVDAYEAALEDGRFSSEELTNVSLLAARAESSLYSTGDHQIFGYATTINDLTRRAARGEWSLVCEMLSDLQFSLPARPGQ